MKRITIGLTSAVTIVLTITTLFLHSEANASFEVDDLNDNTNNDTTNTLVDKLKLERNNAISQGEDWLAKQPNTEIITAHISFERKQSLEQIKNIADKNDIEVKEIHQLIEYGEYAATSGYITRDDENLNESINRMTSMKNSMLRNQIKSLEDHEKNPNLSEEARNSASV
ncbi:hypothetical protein [Oceanobacillus senegalensis]|uniref:hypothetical protein n=1 Tax=Oceanobacillus senegalensis TaxID=1936063 RepID=UPI000A305D48|nr:hypothetical protein [Oceanobacillus senegalensis]